MTFSKAKHLLREVWHELGARVLIVAHENGEALLVAGNEEPQTTSLLAALGAAGLSALQEMVSASFSNMKRGGAQLLTLEVEKGVIVIYALPPVLFLTVLPDKSRLGMARLLLRRLAEQYPWETLLPTPSQEKPQLDASDATQLFADLWRG